VTAEVLPMCSAELCLLCEACAGRVCRLLVSTWNAHVQLSDAGTGILGVCDFAQTESTECVKARQAWAAQRKILCGCRGWRNVA